jgi:8-amino-7-oxononanoate synthase
MTLAARWTAALDDLRGKSRNRAFRPPAGIDFTSNDYLGYAGGRRQPVVMTDLPITGVSSRLLRGHHEIWNEVESMLAAWHGAETALMMTSGYAANEGLIATVAEPGDWVAVDELSHACIIDGLRVARPRKYLFRHNDLTHLEDGLRAEAARRPAGRELFVVTESLFSMDGDTAPLLDMADLCDRYGAHLIVDEAHTTGCFGPTGSGCVDAAGLRGRVLATVHTGGKGLGLPGAYVCGSKLLKEFLTNTCRHLIFTTAQPPAVGAWWRGQIPRVQADAAGRQRLHENAATLRAAIAGYGLEPAGRDYVVPVVVGQDEPSVRAATELQCRGYDVRAIRPPTVSAGTCRLRVSVHADHDPAVLARLAADIAEVLRP